jgi:hypothetical protein
MGNMLIYSELMPLLVEPNQFTVKDGATAVEVRDGFEVCDQWRR